MKENNNMKAKLSFSFGIDGKEFEEVDRFFIVSEEVLGNLEEMFKKFLPTIRKEIKDQFSKKGIPKWEQLKKSYLASSKKINSKYPNKILKLTGKMWKAAIKKSPGHIESVSNDGIVYGIDLETIPYARLHDLGGEIKGICSGNMPQREFLKLTKDGVRRITQKAHRFIRSRMSTRKVKFD